MDRQQRIIGRQFRLERRRIIGRQLRMDGYQRFFRWILGRILRRQFGRQLRMDGSRQRIVRRRQLLGADFRSGLLCGRLV